MKEEIKKMILGGKTAKEIINYFSATTKTLGEKIIEALDNIEIKDYSKGFKIDFTREEGDFDIMIDLNWFGLLESLHPFDIVPKEYSDEVYKNITKPIKLKYEIELIDNFEKVIHKHKNLLDNILKEEGKIYFRKYRIFIIKYDKFYETYNFLEKYYGYEENDFDSEEEKIKVVKAVNYILKRPLYKFNFDAFYNECVETRKLTVEKYLQIIEEETQKYLAQKIIDKKDTKNEQNLQTFIKSSSSDITPTDIVWYHNNKKVVFTELEHWGRVISHPYFIIAIVKDNKIISDVYGATSNIDETLLLYLTGREFDISPWQFEVFVLREKVEFHIVTYKNEHFIMKFNGKEWEKIYKKTLLDYEPRVEKQNS